MLTHGNLIANTVGATAAGKFGDQDVSLSWMPLTHDMGLIGLYLIQFANRVNINLMPTDLFVRRPILWLQMAVEEARHPHLLSELRLPAPIEGSGEPQARRRRPVEHPPDLQRRRAHFRGTVRRIHARARLYGTQAHMRCSRSTGWRRPALP